MNHALIKVWIKAKREASAQVVVRRIQGRLSVLTELGDIKEYNKGEYEVHLSLELKSKSWSEAFYELVKIAQFASASCCVSSRIDEEIYVILNDSRIPGVMSIHFILQNKKIDEHSQGSGT
jgi:hypothetical protein